ncbi:MAG: zinc ribbon domain-containing protein [Clostridiales bacterium]|nr:zinc ribbon domain-containing protein [Clostridiales bacterium]
MKCPNCGHDMADGAAFCVECGNKLPKDEKPQQAQPQQQPPPPQAAAPQQTLPQQPQQPQPSPQQQPQPPQQRQPMQQGYVQQAAPGGQYQQGRAQYGNPGAPYQNPNQGGQYGYPQPPQQATYASGGMPGGIPGGMNELNAPLTVGQFFLHFLICSIPLVGFIMMLVWAFSSESNINRKNLSRAMLIWTLIAVVLSIISSVVFAAAFAGIINELGGSF